MENSKNPIATGVVVTIDLDHGDTNRRMKSEELIQRISYEKLKKQIHIDLEKSLQQPLENGHYPPGNGLAYFIDGTRGAGKSTFLRSVVATLPADLSNEVKKHQVAELSYIDPSRVEDTEIILLLVLKALKQRVEEAARGSHRLEEERHSEDFRRIFKRLAGGLSLFAPGHHPLQDLDPELFLDWGLERAGHSVDLRKNLHSLIRTACHLLNVEALILAFDDAEINGNHAHNVLECIRKYLDTPQLLVFVTGDIELYSLQLRGKFQDNIKSDREGERDRQRVRMIDHLEDQYLLKLFPIRRRVQLRPLWNLLMQGSTDSIEKVDYRLTYHSWSQSRNLEDVVEEIIRRGLRIKDMRDVILYREFLLKQPLRSILQISSRCAEQLSAVDSEKDKSARWEFSLSEALGESLRAVALGALYKFGVDVDAIAADELPALIEAVFDLSIREGDIDTAAYLRPQSSDLGIRNSFAALSSDVANFCAERPDALLQYMFAGPGSVALFGQILKRIEYKRNATDKSELLRQFKQYLGIGRKENALNWARHATVLLATELNSKSAVVSFGVIGLNRKKTNSTAEAPKKKTVSQVIDTLIKQEKPLPVFALSLIDVSGLNTRTFASIYNIIGLMERLLSLKPSESTESQVRNILSRPYPLLSVSRPEWEEEGALAEEESDDKVNSASATDEMDGSDFPELQELTTRVLTWLKDTESARRELYPSAVMIGKIWTRLYFSLEKVSDSRRGKIGAASLMELFALCVVNAFLVEERDHHLLSSGETMLDQTMSRTNPLTSPKSLLKKLEKPEVNRTNLPLTSIIATCPLILGLLNPAIDYRGLTVRLGGSKNNKSSYLCNSESWALLEDISIAGKKSKL
jgi:hypothetical protein